jgi:hypothetical protein
VARLKNRLRSIKIAVATVSLGAASSSLADSTFTFPPVAAGVVTDAVIREASGLVASRISPNVLWTENDSGNPNEIFAIDPSGRLLGTYTLAGTTNKDWEDIAVGPGPTPDVSYIYLMESNSGKDPGRVYRIPEPPINAAAQAISPVTETLSGAQSHVFTFPAPDSEAMFVDPADGDIYLGSKESGITKIYQGTQAEFASSGATTLATPVATVPLNKGNGADITPSGNAIFVRNQGSTALLYPRSPGQTIAAALSNPSPISVHINGTDVEPNAESISFDSNGDNFFTISEGVDPTLYRYDRTSADAPVPAWSANASGNWSDFFNWTSGVPDSPGIVAAFGAAIQSPRTISINSAETAGAITFNNSGAAYTLAGAGSLTLLSSATPAAISVTAGSHTISAALILGSNLTISVATNAKLTLSGAISAAGKTVTINGPGTLALTSTSTLSGMAGNGATTINFTSGRMMLAGGAGAAANLGPFTIAAGATFDIADNELIFHYTSASPAADIRGYLVSGFNAGAWTGTGLDSSSAATDPNLLTGIGYFDSGSSVIVKYTYYGDNNLDGKVDTTDFQMLLDGLVATNASSWTMGDYTYDGHVGLGNDFNLFLRGYLSQGRVLGDLAPIVAEDTNLSGAQKAQLLALVPEPSAAVVVALMPVWMSRRWRRK